MIKKPALKKPAVLFLLAALFWGGANCLFPGEPSDRCMQCHQSKTPGIYAQWKDSIHSKMKVGCYDCHKAEPGDKDSFNHEGTLISVIVSPKDCSRCHMPIVRDFDNSRHAGISIGTS